MSPRYLAGEEKCSRACAHRLLHCAAPFQVRVVCCDVMGFVSCNGFICCSKLLVLPLRTVAVYDTLAV